MPFKVIEGKPTTIHDPRAALDYQWILGPLIDAGDSIISVTFKVALTVPGGDPVPDVDFVPGPLVGNVASGWLNAPGITLLGKTIAVTCEYVTALGRTGDRTLYFKIGYL